MSGDGYTTPSTHPSNPHNQHFTTQKLLDSSRDIQYM